MACVSNKNIYRLQFNRRAPFPTCCFLHAISTVLAVIFIRDTSYLFYLISGILISLCIRVTIDDLFKFELGLFLFYDLWHSYCSWQMVFMQIHTRKYRVFPAFMSRGLMMPRAVHYNYIAGILTLFAPICLDFFKKKKVYLLGLELFFY